MNDKSNTVFTGTNFNKILVLSAVLGQELAANLSSRASRSITITWWHPQKLEPPMCFQALVGFLRSTTASRPLTKGPHCVFLLVWGKISNMNAFILSFNANFAPHKKKYPFGVFAQSLSQWSATSSVPEPESTLEAPASKDATG